MIHFELHRDSFYLAKVPEVIVKGGDESELILQSESTQAEYGFPEVLIGFVNGL